MNFLEKDLEEIIFNSDKGILSDRGLQISGKLTRQLKLGKYGVLDLLSVDRYHERDNSYLVFTIYELKKDNIGVSTFFQSLGYAKAIQVFMNMKKPMINYSIEIALVGKSMDTSGSFCYLPDLICKDLLFMPNGEISNVHLYTYKYEVDGIYFNYESGYSIDNPF